MAFTKLRGVTPLTFNRVVSEFNEQDWREVDAFLAETAHLPYSKVLELSGVDTSMVTDAESQGLGLVEQLRERR